MIAEPTSDNYWDVAEQWRDAYRRKLIENGGYRSNVLSLVWYSIRTLVVGFIVVTPTLLFLLTLLPMWVRSESVSSLLYAFHQSVAEVPIGQSAADYGSTAKPIVNLWVVLAVTSCGFMLALWPWRSPMELRTEHYMDRWHVSHREQMPATAVTHDGE